MDNRLIDLTKLMYSTDWDDEKEAESTDFHLEQFQGTAFSSDYKCVKVTTKGAPLESEDGVFPLTFVAKITVEQERQTLLEMNRLGVPVPIVYGAATCGATTVLYEELVEGREIYGDTDTEHWTTLARTLANVHSFASPFKSVKTFERIRMAETACQQESELKAAYDYALRRLIVRQPQLVHGDMFPTNALVIDDGTVVLIDWADAGYASYVNDLGRLTGMIDINTMKPFCPCEETVRDAYYEAIKGKLSYDDYVQDFYAGQFIETAAYYTPGELHGIFAVPSNKRYAEAVRGRLIEIVGKLNI